MPAPVYLGDEASAAGFRLAGLRVLVPPADAVLPVLEQAAREAPLVLVAAGLASRIPAAALDRLLAGSEHRIVVVPDVHGKARMPELATRIRRQLGVLE